MLNTTFASTSVRPWRAANTQAATPGTFNLIRQTTVPPSYNFRNSITYNGDAIFTSYPPGAGNSNSLVLYNYFSTTSPINLGIGLPNINGSGNLILGFSGPANNSNIGIFNQTSLYSYTRAANITLTGTNSTVNLRYIDLNYQGNLFCFAIGNGQSGGNLGYCKIYDWNGTTATLLANINANSPSNTSAYDIQCVTNNPGNTIIINNPSNFNVQVYEKNGTNINLSANIPIGNSGNYAIKTLINDYSNIMLILVDKVSASDEVHVYKKISNSWISSQIITTNIGNNRGTILDSGISMTGDGSIISIGTLYSLPTALVPRTYIYNYNSSNGNYALSQTIYNPVSNTTSSQFGISTNLSSNPGYLVIGDNIGNTLTIYTSL